MNPAWVTVFWFGVRTVGAVIAARDVDEDGEELLDGQAPEVSDEELGLDDDDELDADEDLDDLELGLDDDDELEGY